MTVIPDQLPESRTMRAFMLPRDIGLFLRSARTDAKLARLRMDMNAGEALEAVYSSDPDPWASASNRYRYQTRKYEVLASLVPPRRYARALDLGAGPGLLSRHLSGIADEVLGVDVSASAVAIARARHADRSNLSFAVHDLLALPTSFDGMFDLVVVADVLYYLSPLDEALLMALADRIARLCAPGGLCMLANHYVVRFDRDSRKSRRIHDVFSACGRFTKRASYRRPFYLVDLFDATASDDRTLV